MNEHVLEGTEEEEEVEVPDEVRCTQLKIITQCIHVV